MKSALRYIGVAGAAAVALFSVYVYRTVQLGRGDAQPVKIENLNPRGEMLGPEGLAFDAKGNLYVGDARATVWKFERGGPPTVYARLDLLQPPVGIRAGGMVFDAQGNLYVAAFGFARGSILKIDPGKNVRFFAHDIGVANALALTGDNRHLWVSDDSRSGRVLRYPLGGPDPAQPDVVVQGLRHPNGIAVGKDEAALFVAETYSGDIVRVDVRETGAAPPTRVLNIKGAFSSGTLDGLAFDPRDQNRRFLYVAENLRGMFTVIDLQAAPPTVVKRYSMSLMGGRPCPASMLMRDGYMYFTDRWACSPLNLLSGSPRYHQHAFRFRLLDLSSLYSP